MVRKQRGTVMIINDLTAHIKLSRSSLYDLCQAGKVPGTKIGRHWRLHKEAIDAWICGGSPPAQAYGKPKANRRKKA